MRSLNNKVFYNNLRFIRIFIFWSVTFLSFTLSDVKAQSSNVVINEFSLSPAQSIEVINISQNDFDIGGYFLDDSSGTTYFTIPANTILKPLECKLFTANFNLNTASPDTVRLFDKNSLPTLSGSRPIDSYSYAVAPDSLSSYLRNPDGTGNFEIGNSSLSLYNTSGKSCENINETPTPIPTPSTVVITTPTSTPTPTPTQTLVITQAVNSPSPPDYKQNIYLSEFMANPTSGNEWIEIYNNNPFAVDLVSWSIDDFEDTGGSAQQFSTHISAYNYAYSDISGSLLNNDNDMVRILDEDENEVCAYTYSNSYQNISWGTESDPKNQIFCLQTPSKGTENNSCIEQTSTPTKTPTRTQTPTKTPTPTPQNISGIYIYEFLAKADDSNPDEWIEIYNDNSFPVTLKGWSLGDEANKFAQSFTADIDPYKFATIDLTTSRLNNSGDTVYLSNNSDETIDSFSYSETIDSTSWGRKPGEFASWCMQYPSKNSFNNSCISLPTQTPTRTQTPTKTPTLTKTPSFTPTPKSKDNDSRIKRNSDILGEATKTVASPQEEIAFTPRSAGGKMLPFSFTVNAESNILEVEDVDTTTAGNIWLDLLKMFENPILSVFSIIILSSVLGIAVLDLVRLWKLEKIAEFEN